MKTDKTGLTWFCRLAKTDWTDLKFLIIWGNLK
jgi:hypothetical protein